MISFLLQLGSSCENTTRGENSAITIVDIKELLLATQIFMKNEISSSSPFPFFGGVLPSVDHYRMNHPESLKYFIGHSKPASVNQH